MPTTLLTIADAEIGRSAGPLTLSELVLPVLRPRVLNANPRRSLRPKSLPSFLRSSRPWGPDGAMFLKVVESSKALPQRRSRARPSLRLVK